MPNITLSVDETVIKKVRKIAVEKDTTLTAMVREYLTELARQEDLKRESAVRELQATFQTSSRAMGRRQWTRDGLYDR